MRTMKRSSPASPFAVIGARLWKIENVSVPSSPFSVVWKLTPFERSPRVVAGERVRP